MPGTFYLVVAGSGLYSCRGGFVKAMRGAVWLPVSGRLGIKQSHLIGYSNYHTIYGSALSPKIRFEKLPGAKVARR